MIKRKSNMYTVSVTLNEMTDFQVTLYDDGELRVLSIPNLSESIICFGIIKNDKYCRLSMKEPSYINAEGEDLVLTKEDIDRLMDILNKPSTSNLFKREYTVWELLISEQNEELRNEISGWFVGDLSIPNYYELLK